jgi:hypothetical protein
MTHEEPPEPKDEPGREIGLGRVVEDPLSIGRPEPDSPATGDERAVREASEDSFPASDPPTWMSDPPTPKRRHSEKPPAER